MEISIIITAWKESKSIKEAFDRILNPIYKNLLPETEIILACPDKETFESARNIVKKYKFSNFVYVKDPQKGKPFALTLAMKKATGKYLFLTDGDVYIGENAIPLMMKKFSDDKVAGVTGHPISSDPRNTLLGYYGNLLADAAHHKRLKEFTKGDYYFMSGYLMAIRNLNIEVPSNVLSDDAWITNKLVEMGYKIKYEPEAKVFVKYPKTFADWYKQKTRSVGGYSQLKNFNIVKKKDRKIYEELKYLAFPFSHAKNIKELSYLFVIYPARMILWMRIWKKRYLEKNNFEKLWVRIESTK